MGSDAIANAAPLPAFVKDKKKKVNKLTKLKQNKFDVRREQWLSHVKNKSFNKVDSNGLVGSIPSSNGESTKMPRIVKNMRKVRTREDEDEILSSQDSELESLMSSSIGSSLSHDGSTKDSPGSSSSSSSSGYCSGGVSEEEKDEGCQDDWEAIADALSLGNNQQKSNPEPLLEHEHDGVSDESKVDGKNNRDCIVAKGTNRAWSPDDTLRPQGLPDISKQQLKHPPNSGRCCARGPKTWPWRTVAPQLSACPICCEDLDITDSSFLPCPCGFRVCLFCHKRILEVDGRCPGCRKQYDSKDPDTSFVDGASELQICGSWSRKLKF